MSKPLIVALLSFIVMLVKMVTGKEFFSQEELDIASDIVLQIIVFVGAYLHKRKENAKKDS